jgi:hypothetical protein
MTYNDEENRYKQAIDVLKQLPKVTAPPDFEADLMRRINSESFEEKKEGFWDILLSPSRLIPTGAMAALIVILLFVVNTSNVQQADPLSLAPRLRADASKVNNAAGISLDNELKKLSRQTNEPQNIPESDNSEGVRFTTASNITKAGLNFRQIQLTDEEKQVLEKLKMKVQKYLHEEKKTHK